MGLSDIFVKKTSLAESGILKGMHDSHSHILFGVDDGIRRYEGSLKAIEFEQSLGITEIWCTPHIMEDIPNKTSFLQERFRELCSYYTGPVRLHLAAEYMLDGLYKERLESDDLLLLKDDLVLVETSTRVPPYNFDELISNTMKAGYRPVLAHPERYRYLENSDYERLHDKGILFQMNLPCLVGSYGETARQKAAFLLSKKLYSFFGSDCHNPQSIMDSYQRKVLTKRTVRFFG